MKVENGPLKPKRPRPKRPQWKKKQDHNGPSQHPKQPILMSKTAHYVKLYKKYRINVNAHGAFRIPPPSSRHIYSPPILTLMKSTVAATADRRGTGRRRLPSTSPSPQLMRRPSPSQPPQLSHSPSLCSSLSSHDVLQPDNSRSPSPRSPTPTQRSREVCQPSVDVLMVSVDVAYCQPVRRRSSAVVKVALDVAECR